MKFYTASFIFLLGIQLISCGGRSGNDDTQKTGISADSITEYGRDINLAEPLATQPTNKFATVLGWPDDKKPTAPSGYRVEKFAGDLNNPRQVYVAPNGDIFVSEARTVKDGEDVEEDLASGKTKSDNENFKISANRITLFRDSDGDGKHDERHEFLKDLNQPFGMLVLDGHFYVANTDGLWRYPYKEGETSISSKGEKLVSLPAGGYNNHWTRNLIANKEGSKIYITVGSSTNNGEQGLEVEERRANILEINPDGSGERIFAAGLRNPVGVDWEPTTGKLWTAVNERDELGDEIVPDYITSVQEGGFYGWPFAYWGSNADPRMDGQRSDLVEQTLVPDFALGSHTASLGLSFNKTDKFPNGVYVGQHGSWNRSEFVGYKVVFVPFADGKPTGEHEDFLTGFIANEDESEVYGRPVEVTFAQPGYMLVTDDAANTIWAVLPE